MWSWMCWDVDVDMDGWMGELDVGSPHGFGSVVWPVVRLTSG